MAESIHGHEVMQMMVESEKSFTKESLEKAIIEKFGTDSKFHTCCASDLTPKELVDFLEGKDKFIDSEEGFTTDASKICNH